MIRLSTPPLFKSLAILGLLAVIGCTSSPDKRVLQYLNTDGFGKRFVGNSLHDNYLTVLTMGRDYASPEGTTLISNLIGIAISGFATNQIGPLVADGWLGRDDLDACALRLGKPRR